MRVTKISEALDSAYIFEYNVGNGQREVTYPGLQQCISVTGYSAGGVLGTHISPGATADEIKEHFRLLRTECGSYYPTWYVVGQFQEHFDTPNAIMSSMEEVRKTLRKRLGRDDTYYVLDTSTLSQSLHYTYGIDIRASLISGELSFGFAKSGGSRDKSFKSFNSWYFNRL